MDTMEPSSSESPSGLIYLMERRGHTLVYNFSTKKVECLHTDCLIVCGPTDNVDKLPLGKHGLPAGDKLRCSWDEVEQLLSGTPREFLKGVVHDFVPAPGVLRREERHLVRHCRKPNGS